MNNYNKQKLREFAAKLRTDLAEKEKAKKAQKRAAHEKWLKERAKEEEQLLQQGYPPRWRRNEIELERMRSYKKKATQPSAAARVARGGGGINQWLHETQLQQDELIALNRRDR